jgi:hypothetical protein
VDEEQLSEMEDNQAMFVQTAQEVSSGGGRLTLRGLAPSTLYFSDRPQRVVGHLSTAQFVDLWDEGDNSFAEDPPNAVLAFLEPGDDVPEHAVVVLQDPSVDDGAVSYAIDVLEGPVPSATGPATLFIDPLGRPMTPVSVAGVHRRARRRTRRAVRRRL